MSKEVVKEVIRAWAANFTITISINIDNKTLKLLEASSAIISFNSNSNNTIFGMKMQGGHEEELTGTIQSFLVTIEDPIKTFSELQIGKINFFYSTKER